MKFIILTLIFIIMNNCEKNSLGVIGCDGVVGSGKVLDSCGTCDEDPSNDCLRKVYVTNQSQDYVTVLNAEVDTVVKNIKVGFDSVNCNSFNNDEIECEQNGCNWMNHNGIDMCMGNTDNVGNTPHFISIDETNGYWFVTLMDAGYIEQYCIKEDTLIDRIEIGDLPSLSTIDIQNKNIYISRMNMPGMPSMSSATNVINKLSYSNNGLVDELEIDICNGCSSIGPHAISIDIYEHQLYTASILTDHIFKINLISNEIQWQFLGDDTNSNPNIITQLYKPIQSINKNGYLFVTCSAGGDIEGQVQMYNSSNLEKIDSYNFDVNSNPWHIIVGNTNSNRLYVTLSGSADGFGGGEGVACLQFTDSELSLVWKNDNLSGTMVEPHGIALSFDEEKLFVSDRSNGKIYFLNALDGELLDEMNLSITSIGSSTALGGVANTQNLW